ncbi:MAG: hypothetical protein K2J72_08530 [Oscillospiraceae bacterium]|nr:hypothetical protein [Oscillospiraceae bacterium]
MKKIAAFLAAFMTLMSFTACNNTAKDDNLLAENDISTTSAQETADTVSEIEESDTEKNDDADIIETVYFDVCWLAADEEEMYNDCDIIADVTIKSLEEIAISYTFMGTECTSYKTLATVSVNKIYFSSEENINQEFIVAIPNSSYQFDEDFPKTEIGESCIFFISSTAGLNDSLELYNYADYYLGHPADIININGLECDADEIFSDYSSSSAPVVKNEMNTGRCSMPLSDFEDTLIAKINEKK